MTLASFWCVVSQKPFHSSVFIRVPGRIDNVGIMIVHVGQVILIFVTSCSQEIFKYFMFATIFYCDYPPLHRSSADLVLCGLLTPTSFLKDIFFLLIINQGSFGRKVSQGKSLSCLVLLRERFLRKNGKFTFFHFFLTFLSLF